MAKYIGYIASFLLVVILAGVGCNYSQPEMTIKSNSISPVENKNNQLPTTNTQPSTSPTKDSKSSSTTPASTVVVDCKSDFNCFINQVNKCAKSKVVVSNSANLSPLVPLIISATTRYEITGMNKGACNFTTQILSNAAKFTPEGIKQMKAEGKTQTEIDAEIKQTNNTAKEAVKLTSYCSADSISNLVAVLKDRQAGKGSGSFEIGGSNNSQTIGPGVTCLTR